KAPPAEAPASTSSSRWRWRRWTRWFERLRILPKRRGVSPSLFLLALGALGRRANDPPDCRVADARPLPFGRNRSNADPLNPLRRPSDGKSGEDTNFRARCFDSEQDRSAPMGQKTNPIDIAKALMDPASVFSQP